MGKKSKRREQKINIAAEIPWNISGPNVLFVLPYGVSSVSFRNVIRSSFLLDNLGLEIEAHVDGNIETLITGSKNDRTTRNSIQEQFMLTQKGRYFKGWRKHTALHLPSDPGRQQRKLSVVAVNSPSAR